MDERMGNGVVRHAFRPREGVGEERLPVGKCGKCGRETYQTLTGLWLHWSTLTSSCPTRPTQPIGRGGLRPPVGAVGADDGLGSLCNGQEGAIS